MEILFRGKPMQKRDNSILKRFDDSFVYGFAVGLSSDPDHIFTNLLELVPVFEYTITQYVGQVDADGKKVFDGDILEYEYDGEKYLVEVFFDEKQSAFCIRDVGYSYGESIDFVKECRVVGNVFEDPELLISPKKDVK